MTKHMTAEQIAKTYLFQPAHVAALADDIKSYAIQESKMLVDAANKLLNPTFEEKKGWNSEDLFDAALEELEQVLITFNERNGK